MDETITLNLTPAEIVAIIRNRNESLRIYRILLSRTGNPDEQQPLQTSADHRSSC